MIHNRSQLPEGEGESSVQNLWTEGKSRCSYCLDEPDSEWEIICDCLLYQQWVETPILKTFGKEQ